MGGDLLYIKMCKEVTILISLKTADDVKVTGATGWFHNQFHFLKIYPNTSEEEFVLLF